jgi:polar amino acid transport system substrate-binding protein
MENADHRARWRPAAIIPAALALGGALLCGHATPAAAGQLQNIEQSGTLRWCGDQEGGGPFVYPRDDDPSQVTGFEVDLAAQLATYLKVKPEFVQGQWDKLPDMLRTDKCDIVLNGYEYDDERLDVMEATVPYYVYGLQLLVRKGDPVWTGWDALKAMPEGQKAKIGVLTGSAAEETMREFCGEDNKVCEVINYDGSTDTMREVETGKLDATLQDTPIASFYAPRFPGLAAVGEPVNPGYYVIFVKKGETELRDQLNTALILLNRNGEQQAIYQKYGIWDAQQDELRAVAEMGKFYGQHQATRVEVEEKELPTQEVVTTEVRKRGWDVVTSYGGVLVESAGLTVLLAVVSFPMAVLIGLGVAVGRLYGPAWMRLPLTAYVEFLRGTPLMLQLYFIFFMLPEVGITIPALWTGILGLAINYSAYESEIYRAGLQAIPGGQMEAALSLGMTRGQALHKVIVPQAVRIVIPPVVNDFIALFKDTSVVSVVTLVELTKRFSVLSLSTQATVELMLMTALLYLLMSYPMSLLSRRVEARLGGVSA